jgi:hypothetical protein
MKITEINGITDSIIERDATPEEVALIKEEQDERAEAKAAEEAAEAERAIAKAALLDRLGITADEAALLLG